MIDIIVAIDAGGTELKATAMTLDKHTLLPIQHYPSNSKESSQVIVCHFHYVVQSVYSMLKESSYRLVGIALGFPGPFDYDQGISYMKNLGKYESLYGMPFKTLLLREFSLNPMGHQSPTLTIQMANDAYLFALGAYHQVKGSNRMLAITIGTGCGSTFIKEGHVVKGQDGVPSDGMVYHLPFAQSTIDDHLSRRGILKLAKDSGISDPSLDVIDLYHLATKGNASVLKLFNQFGEILLDALKPLLIEFRADTLVIGGQIAKSHTYFCQALNQYATSNNLKVIINTDTSATAISGAYYHFIHSIKNQ